MLRAGGWFLVIRQRVFLTGASSERYHPHSHTPAPWTNNKGSLRRGPSTKPRDFPDGDFPDGNRQRLQFARLAADSDSGWARGLGGGLLAAAASRSRRPRPQPAAAGQPLQLLGLLAPVVPNRLSRGGAASALNSEPSGLLAGPHRTLPDPLCPPGHVGDACQLVCPAGWRVPATARSVSATNWPGDTRTGRPAAPPRRVRRRNCTHGATRIPAWAVRSGLDFTSQSLGRWSDAIIYIYIYIYMADPAVPNPRRPQRIRPPPPSLFLRGTKGAQSPGPAQAAAGP
jgi:hypothetical protein